MSRALCEVAAGLEIRIMIAVVLEISMLFRKKREEKNQTQLVRWEEGLFQVLHVPVRFAMPAYFGASHIQVFWRFCYLNNNSLEWWI